MNKALLPEGVTFLTACFFIDAYFCQGGFDLESAAQAFGLALLGLLIIYGVWGGCSYHPAHLRMGTMALVSPPSKLP